MKLCTYQSETCTIKSNIIHREVVFSPQKYINSIAEMLRTPWNCLSECKHSIESIGNHFQSGKMGRGRGY